jgi:hypothetical protein
MTMNPVNPLRVEIAEAQVYCARPRALGMIIAQKEAPLTRQSDCNWA